MDMILRISERNVAHFSLMLNPCFMLLSGYTDVAGDGREVIVNCPDSGNLLLVTPKKRGGRSRRAVFPHSRLRGND